MVRTKGLGTLLGGSWAVASRVMSMVTMHLSLFRELKAPTSEYSCTSK